MFKGGRTYFHDEQSGHPFPITEDLKNRTGQHIRTNTHFILNEIDDKFSQISHSPILEIVMKHLHNQKICARWVPWMLTEKHKTYGCWIDVFGVVSPKRAIIFWTR
jgi:hypothetical protein